MNRKELQQMNYEKKHKEVDGVVYKQCSIHKEYSPNDENDWFPCTEEYFHKNKSSPDGLYPYCKTCNSKKNSEWSKNNHDKKLIYWRKEYGTPKRRESYRRCSKNQRESGYRKEWEQNNPDKMKKYQENRKQHGNHKITTKEWKSCKDYFNNQCAYCGLPLNQHYNKYKGEVRLTDFHKEHVNHEGANDLSNCIPSCKTCNTSKHQFNMEEWYKSNHNFNEERLDKIYKWLEEDYKLYYIEPKPRKKYTYKDKTN